MSGITELWESEGKSVGSHGVMRSAAYLGKVLGWSPSV